MFYISEISVSLQIEALHDPVSRLSAFGCMPEDSHSAPTKRLRLGSSYEQ